MILSYRDEIDLRMTKYGDNWKSPYLADNPIYTDELQRIDRWCRRRYELGRRQELNEAYKQSKDKEKRRRRQHNDCLNVDEIAQEEVEELRAKYIESDMEMEIELAIELQKDLEYFNEGR